MPKQMHRSHSDFMPANTKLHDVATMTPATGATGSRFAHIAGWLAAILRVHIKHVRVLRRLPNVLAPRRFTDKVQWRKLFDMNPIYTVMSDKLAARGFISARVGDAELVPLIWSGLPG